MAEEYYPPVPFYFNVMIKKEAFGFSEVKGLTSEMQTMEIPEGGENRFVHRVPGRMKFSQKLILKRGMQIKKTATLVTWCMETLSFGGGNSKKKIEPKNVIVHLLDEKGKPAASWLFDGAYPVKWTISDLNSMSDNNVLIEEIELCYRYFKRFK